MAATLPRITDPSRVPVVGADDHLPPLDVAALDTATIRRRLQAAARRAPEWPGDGGAFGQPSPWKRAAVLVTLVAPASTHGWQVVLTRRTEHLRDHAGQISFPGGRVEPGDASETAAALREAWEEIGLDPGAVDVLGHLPTYRTVTRYEVTPVVGVVADDVPLRPDPSEVDEVFEVPLAHLMTPAHHRRHRVVLGPPHGHRDFLSMPWRAQSAPDGRSRHVVGREYFIWGATAGMLRNLYGALRGPGA